MRRNIKPFIKWAGGKSQLLSELKNNFPSMKNIKRYVEPFVGGGALVFDILNNIEEYSFEEIIINDINSKLIKVYICIKEDCDKLINYLKNIKENYLSLETLEEKEKFYYDIRNNFNQEKSDNYLVASEFIFLNKTGYNGLYRENKKGAFNVPFGKQKEPGMYDEDMLKEISKVLNLKNSFGKDLVTILNLNYNELKQYANEYTFFYFDPPYRPVTKGGFNEYTKSSFNDKEQILLADFCKEISNRGSLFLLSNSDPKVLNPNDNFFDDLYADFEIKRISASRMINSNSKGRGKINELLINNFDKEVKFDYFNEWDKFINKDFNIELIALNILIKNNNFNETLKSLLKKMPQIVNIFPLLIAMFNIEKNGNKIQIINAEYTNIPLKNLDIIFDIEANINLSEKEIEKYILFTEKFGIKYFFMNILKENVLDYMNGIKTIMDIYK